MKINVWISDSGSSAIFVVETTTGAIVKIIDTGGMPVEKLVGRVKDWTGGAKKIKARLESAWNVDCESADDDPYIAEITSEDGSILA